MHCNSHLQFSPIFTSVDSATWRNEYLEKLILTRFTIAQGNLWEKIKNSTFSIIFFLPFGFLHCKPTNAEILFQFSMFLLNKFEASSKQSELATLPYASDHLKCDQTNQIFLLIEKIYILIFIRVFISSEISDERQKASKHNKRQMKNKYRKSWTEKMYLEIKILLYDIFLSVWIETRKKVEAFV